MSGRHRGDDGPRTEPLGLLVASGGRHGDLPPEHWERPPRRWPAVAGLVTVAGLAVFTGWAFGRGPQPDRTEPTASVTRTVTRTPEPEPGPTLTRWRTTTAPPPPARIVTRISTVTVTAAAPTVTRWRTVTPPPPKESHDDGTETALPGEASAGVE